MFQSKRHIIIIRLRETIVREIEIEIEGIKPEYPPGTCMKKKLATMEYSNKIGVLPGVFRDYLTWMKTPGATPGPTEDYILYAATLLKGNGTVPTKTALFKPASLPMAYKILEADPARRRRQSRAQFRRALGWGRCGIPSRIAYALNGA
eukprot:1175349-Prorocentrum_minimum.AAC.1